MWKHIEVNVETSKEVVFIDSVVYCDTIYLYE